MSFKFPDLSSLQQQLQQTSQQFTLQLQTGLEQVSKELSSLNDNLQPFFKRTTRLAQEKLGGIDDISELPHEYIELEKKVDNLKKIYQKILDITEQYLVESYDYPPHLRENIQDVTKSFTEKLQSLSQATTTAELEAILISSGEKPIPKTFHHQFGKALASVKLIDDDALTKLLAAVSEIEFKIGDARLSQDREIIVEFNNKIKELLSTQFTVTNNYRKNVENARITFDVLRSESKGYEENSVPESLQGKLDLAEDDLVNATEIAVESMKKLISPVEPVTLLKAYNKIQLNYYKNVVSLLTELDTSLGEISLDDEDDK